MSAMGLKEYREKRDFARTPEPSAAQAAEREGPLVFVVQRHSARRLHYDLRLELDGVLKSWAVPEGPSLDPKVKRLAVMVEDHPLDYGFFEGTIPRGEYGAGQVVVWDYGDYSPEDGGRLLFGDRASAEERVQEGLAQGKLTIVLRGRRLKGSWALVKMKRGEKDWLLIKHQDEFAAPESAREDEGASVLDAAREPDAKPSAPVVLSGVPGARPAAMPRTLSPMLASLADAPFSDPAWLFEPKLDGYRTIAAVQDGNVRLLSRRGLDVTAKYAGIAAALRRQPAAQVVLDGEIVALDKRGKLCFQCLQRYLETMKGPDSQGEEAAAVIYFVFDVLYLDGYDLRELPLTRRREILGRVLAPSKLVRPLEQFEGDGVAIYRGAVEAGLEGVVAKRRDSIYESGRRSANWLKVKSARTDDFVVGGFTLGTGNRAAYFGALLLGQYDGSGRLIFAGHVGTGFDDRALADLSKRLDALKTEKCPFAEEPEVNTPATWVRPELVVEVKFSEWTRDGRLRVPVYMRVRDDKPAEQVARSEATAEPVLDAPAKPDPPDSELRPILEQMRNLRSEFTLHVQGSRVGLTNLDKALWPERGAVRPLTKRDLLVYLTKVSPHLLSHMRDRPLTLSRYPGGVGGEQFFQKHWRDNVPDFVETIPLTEQRQKRQDYLLCNNLATLLWLGQVANLEYHTWFSRISPGPDRDLPADVPGSEAGDFISRYPDFIVFDLDPYIYSGAEPPGAEPELNREGFARTCETALWLKEVLDELSLPCFVKTSGRSGLHIYVPVVRQLDFRATRAAGRTICEFVQRRHPEAVTTYWAVERRSGKVFLDFNQNARGKTLVSVYSPRAAPEATVSCPLRWDELGKVYPTDFTLLSLPDRLARIGDLWAGILEARADLKQLAKLS